MPATISSTGGRKVSAVCEILKVIASMWFPMRRRAATREGRLNVRLRNVIVMSAKTSGASWIARLWHTKRHEMMSLLVKWHTSKSPTACFLHARASIDSDAILIDRKCGSIAVPVQGLTVVYQETLAFYSFNICNIPLPEQPKVHLNIYTTYTCCMSKYRLKPNLQHGISGFYYSASDSGIMLLAT